MTQDQQGGMSTIKATTDVRAERSLLGSLILAPECIPTVDRELGGNEEVFTDHTHRMVFTQLRWLDQNGGVTDQHGLNQEMFLTRLVRAEVVEDLDQAGSLVGSYIRAVNGIRTVPTGFANRLVELYQARKAISALDAVRSKVTGVRSGRVSLEEAVEASVELLSAVPRRQVEDPDSVKNVITDLRMELTSERQGLPDGLAFGIEPLDEVIRLTPSHLVVLAARPSHGKSTFALAVAVRQMLSGVPVAVYSMEMSFRDVVRRLAPILAWHAEGSLTRAAQLRALDLAEKLIRQGILNITDACVRRVSEVHADARYLRSKGTPLGLIIVDYVQQLEPPTGATGMREQDVANVSRSLKLIARELNVPVLALSQLSRKAEERKDAPRLSDLRESGALEQDADAVLFIHRQSPGSPDGELILAKNRYGATLSLMARIENAPGVFESVESKPSEGSCEERWSA